MKFEKLYLKRRENNYTHMQMANMLDISKSYYCQIENNKRKLTYDMAYRISKILKCKPDDLFYDSFVSTKKVDSNN
ncbi:MAG: helix-turn-helix transcriptional regulator [Bacilli bacterium]|jgi:putative transcriptional regulator|nr:helix-turn-helix transcriptional regulator [Bacilli bacterium]